MPDSLTTDTLPPDPNQPANAGDSFLPPEEQDPAGTKAKADDKKHQKLLKIGVDACERLRKTQDSTFKTNVNYRKGKPFDQDPERDEIVVNTDWARTKNKIAQLAVQVPKMTLKARAPQWVPLAPLTGAMLTFELQHEMKVHKVVEECLADIINAAGFGAFHCVYEAAFEKVEQPLVDVAARTPDELLALAKQHPQGLPMATAQRTLYQKFRWDRISPRNFVSPVDFTGSDWRQAPFLGYKGQLPRAEMERRGWIKAGEDIPGVDTTADRSVNDELEQSDRAPADNMHGYTLVYYRPSHFRTDKHDCREIWRIIWVDGKPDPVRDEPLPWQRYDTTTREWVGNTEFPIKPCTLTYISDESLPPSDSEIGRPQVREMNRSRSQMILQRDRSQPVRWADINLVDEDVLAQMRRGVYQDWVPTQGPGGNVFGEVARASYPRESWEFMKVFTDDLNETWSSGPNQQGFDTTGATTAKEAEIVQGNFAVGLEHQRAKVLEWIVDGAECTLEQIQMFAEDTKWVPFGAPGVEKVLTAWKRPEQPAKFLFEVRPDGAVRIDVNQKKSESLNIFKLTRRDELINPIAPLSLVLEAHDLDSSLWLAKPKAKEDMTIKQPTFSFKGDDLANPMAVALILKAMNLKATDIEAAKMLMAECGIPIAPMTIRPDMAPHPTDAAPPEGPPNGAEAMHGGLPPQVDPIGQRYERNAEGAHASPDSQL